MSVYVTVQGSISHGTVLVAAQNLHAGLTIATELPLLMVPGRVLSTDMDSAYRAYQAFLVASSSDRGLILALFSPVDGQRAALMREKAQGHSQIRLLSVLDLEVLIKVAMVRSSISYTCWNYEGRQSVGTELQLLVHLQKDCNGHRTTAFMFPCST